MLFFDLFRCNECDELRRNWEELALNLKDSGIENLIVSQANCCIETDLCDTLDLRTKCLNDDIMRGIDLKYNNFIAKTF